MQSSELILPSANLTLHAQTWGNPSNPPLLALHGWLDNSASFAPLANVLSHFYVIAPDLVGHGLSDHLSSNVAYSLETNLLVLLSALDPLDLKQFAVMGHSLGAGIASALAIALPTRVSHLIMLDKLGPPAVTDAEFLEQFLLNTQSRLLRERPMIYKSKEEAINLRMHMTACSEKTSALLTERNLRAVENGFTSRSDRRLQFKSHRSVTENQSHAVLAAVKCPMLLIRAESGMMKNFNEADVSEKYKNLQIKNIPGNHHVHMEEPSRIAEMLNAFLA